MENARWTGWIAFAGLLMVIIGGLDFFQGLIAVRPIMNLTLTYDHRLVDGALAGRFLRDVRQRLESWGESDY